MQQFKKLLMVHASLLATQGGVVGVAEAVEEDSVVEDSVVEVSVVVEDSSVVEDSVVVEGSPVVEDSVEPDSVDDVVVVASVEDVALFFLSVEIEDEVVSSARHKYSQPTGWT